MKGNKRHWCQLLFAQTLLALATVQGSGEAVNIFQGFVSQIGFDFMLLLDASIHGTAFANDPVIWSNWPRCLTRFSANAKKHQYHPLQKLTRRIWRPTTWRELKPLTCPSTEHWFDHAAYHQMHGGVFIPINDKGQKSMFILAGHEKPRIEKLELQVLAKSAFADALPIVPTETQLTPSDYERLVLQYASQGHTAADIAGLIGKPIHSVKQALRRVQGKFQTNKTIHAVSIGIRDGHIL